MTTNPFRIPVCSLPHTYTYIHYKRSGDSVMRTGAAAIKAGWCDRKTLAGTRATLHLDLSSQIGAIFYTSHNSLRFCCCFLAAVAFFLQKRWDSMTGERIWSPKNIKIRFCLSPCFFCCHKKRKSLMHSFLFSSLHNVVMALNSH